MPATFDCAAVSIAGMARSYAARLSLFVVTRLRRWGLAGIQELWYPGVFCMPNQVRHDGLLAVFFIQPVVNPNSKSRITLKKSEAQI